MGQAASFPPHNFPFLSKYFDKGSDPPLVGLLFSAGWCPDCQPFVPKLFAMLEEEKDTFSKLLRVVYVSSETSGSEMREFLEKSGVNNDMVQSIPYDNASERIAVKKKYSTCAEKEMETVGLTERAGGIPTLKLLDATGNVVLEDAVPDVEKLTALEAAEKWKSLID
mmetsp:Transcript_10040/g.27755  ORF Transcript_10040/g.27755 Transcript_10040/m.27755 type:complete len:167 (-) Transcript_10040:221-721(-)